MRKAALVSIGAVVVVTAYYYLVPHLAVRGLETAIRERDAAALDERVDFSHLRENLKGQLSAMMVKKTGPLLKDNPLGALATGFASIFVGGMVESLVTPDGLAALASGEDAAEVDGRVHAAPVGCAEGALRELLLVAIEREDQRGHLLEGVDARLRG